MALNFNDTTPAAPAGATNVKWQRDVSGNVSAYIVNSEATVDLTAQSADVATTTLVASPDAELYRVTVYIVLTQAATTSSTLPAVQLQWSDQDTTVVNTASVTATSAANVVGTTYAQATFVLSAEAAASISYATSGYASVGATPMKFALHIRVEEL